MFHCIMYDISRKPGNDVFSLLMVKIQIRLIKCTFVSKKGDSSAYCTNYS
jgi:hypothetical protein